MVPPTSEREATYHNDSDCPYFMANDAPEHHRLDMQSNAIIAMMKGRPFWAPAANRGKMLDVGCGTGTMTVLLGDKNPDADVYGLDVSPVPARSGKPSNVEFVQGKVQDVVGTHPLFRGGSFTYTFSRLVNAGMTAWPEYVKGLFDLLESGGWAEFQEPKMEFRDQDGKKLKSDWKWLRMVLECSHRVGMDPYIMDRLEKYMTDAGFVDIKRHEFTWTWSQETWDKHPESDAIGRYSVEEFQTHMPMMLERLMQSQGYEREQIIELQQALREDLDTRKMGDHFSYFVVCGRKP